MSQGHASSLFGVFTIFAAGSSMTRGDYMLEITDGDATPDRAVVSPGDSITLLLLLTGPPGTQHDSFVFDVTFSAPGLFYASYDLDPTAFSTGEGEDYSIPAISELLADPAYRITAASYTPPFPSNDVDIHFDALTALDADGNPFVFETGVLVRIDLSVPPGFQGGDILIEVVPETFALGFEVVDTAPGSPFTLSVAGGTSGGGTGDAGGAPTPSPPAVVDDDGDGIADESDECANTPPDVEVDENGCPLEAEAPDPIAVDLDADGVADEMDECLETAPGVVVDESGCAQEPEPPLPAPTVDDEENDGDGDGVVDEDDSCPQTPAGAEVGEDGCEPVDDDPSAAPIPIGRPAACGAVGAVNLSWIAVGLIGLALTPFGTGRHRHGPRPLSDASLSSIIPSSDEEHPERR